MNSLLFGATAWEASVVWLWSFLADGMMFYVVAKNQIIVTITFCE